MVATCGLVALPLQLHFKLFEDVEPPDCVPAGHVSRCREDGAKDARAVVTFAFRLAHAISSAWDAVVVKSLGEDEREKAQARLFSCMVVRGMCWGVPCGCLRSGL
ncbi:hypothetical protein DFP72DRAFT_182978 [Ephemerocybe angulata]|uniref:Uncharacterized protein n=1 Tax=Ephemerocybe angulata TaxID=980116 RepID=A0A8H6H8D6_9AGAR|nr:hypothetical protein DFP72DRAFT_182978 [Tulosesus angulatus]